MAYALNYRVNGLFIYYRKNKTAELTFNCNYFSISPHQQNCSKTVSLHPLNIGHQYMLSSIRLKISKTKYSLIDLFSKLTGKGLDKSHQYDSYEDYLEHQKLKTQDKTRIKKWLGEEWQIKLDGFKELFIKHGQYLENKKTAICLGARTGQEVKALLDMGKEAIGIDIVPFEPYTVSGDIHDLQYDDNTYDFVFSNIFDHALYPDKFCQEMERVCSKNGIIMLRLQLGSDVDEFTETVVYDPQKVVGLFSNVELLESNSISDAFDAMNWELILKKC